VSSCRHAAGAAAADVTAVASLRERSAAAAISGMTARTCAGLLIVVVATSDQPQRKRA
jgi:hypothetical protein